MAAEKAGFFGSLEEGSIVLDNRILDNRILEVDYEDKRGMSKEELLGYRLNPKPFIKRYREAISGNKQVQ